MNGNPNRVTRGVNDVFAVRMRTARERAGKSIADAAGTIGISADKLQKVETGSATALDKPLQLQRAGQCYGVTTMWLHAGQDAPRRFWPAWIAVVEA